MIRLILIIRIIFICLLVCLLSRISFCDSFSHYCDCYYFERSLAMNYFQSNHFHGRVIVFTSAVVHFGLRILQTFNNQAYVPIFLLKFEKEHMDKVSREKQ